VFHHALGTAAGAEASFLAAECYEVFVFAQLALHPQKAVFEAAALEVRLELLLYKVRQRAFGLGHQGAERGVVG